MTDAAHELERIERELKAAKKTSKGSLDGAEEAFRAVMEAGLEGNAPASERAAQLAVIQQAYQTIQELRSNDTDRVFLLLSERDEQKQALSEAFERVQNLELPLGDALH